MTSGIRFAAAVLILTAACFAQEGLTVRAKGKQTWPAAEAQKIYLSACAVVQREFGANPSVTPSVTVVLGADKNEVEFGQQEIRLKKWDRNAFAQGVKAGRNLGRRNPGSRTGRALASFKIMLVRDAWHNCQWGENHDEDRLAKPERQSERNHSKFMRPSDQQK